MESPATASWDLCISDADFQKLKVGFEAEDMNQRWEITAKEPDENGIIAIHISRSWTDEDHYILAVKPSDEGGAKITSITWEQEVGEVHMDEERGKRGAVIVCRMVLHCDFKTLPLYDRKSLWN
jgi:hypothetical protein